MVAYPLHLELRMLQANHVHDVGLSFQFLIPQALYMYANTND